MFRSLIASLITLSVTGCAVTDSEEGKSTGKQPFVYNKFADTDSYSERVVFIGTNNQYREAFRRIYNDNGACPYGYEPAVQIDRQIINADWLAEYPSTPAELRRQIDDLYSWDNDEWYDRMRNLEYFLSNPASSYLVRTVYRNRSCTKL